MSHRYEEKSGGVPKTMSTSGGGGDRGLGGYSSRSNEKRPLPPPPPMISVPSTSSGVKKPKLAFSIAKKSQLTPNSTLKSVQQEDKSQARSALKQAFNSDSDEEEEIPREVKMRMRNFGRDTPTSSGPNSFGKTKQGFCDAKHMFEKKLKAAAEKPTK